MSRKMYGYSVLLASSLLAISLAGCGTDKKEGTAAADVAKVDEASCAQCHGSAREKLTGRVIYDDYAQSIHLIKGVGCQDCHGGGAQHNGVGPIPYPSPNHIQCAVCHDADKLVTNFVASKHNNVAKEEAAVCNRCHSHQGAVLATIPGFGFTGDGTVMDAGVNAPAAIATADWQPIKCNTCHLTHKPNELRVDAGWNPGTTVGAVPAALADNTVRAQYRLCTQCHTYINAAGILAGSGTTTSATVKVGHHETSWNRVLASTHYDTAAASGNAITGYGVRTTSANPCFDCHGHESMTNTISGDATIYTEWAASGHAGGLLTAKKAAADTVTVPAGSRTDPARVAAQKLQVDTVMAASVSGAVWNEHNTAGCNRCHTATGFVSILATPTGASQPALTVGQVLACWGCHSDAAKGTLRTLSGTKFTNYTGSKGWNPIGYTLNYGKKGYPDVKGSNLCIQCHDSREKDPGAITDLSTTYQRTHYMQAAATMYVKMGFLNLSTGTAGTTAAYLKTLKSSQDGGSITSTHRKLGTPGMIGDHGITAADTGLLANGPCVACHFAEGNHTLSINQKTITAVCNKCHSSEEGHAITTIADFNTYFIEPQSESYQVALKLAIDVFNAKNCGITLAPESLGSTYVRAYRTSTLTSVNDGTGATEAGAADWTTAMAQFPSIGNLNVTTTKTKVLGAVSNIVFLKREPAAYVHARTYSRRLLYDTIDFLDDGILNMSVSTTAKARSLLPAGTSTATTTTVNGLFTKAATAFTDSTLTAITPGTSEGMIYLIGWSRTTGGWNAVERP